MNDPWSLITAGRYQEAVAAYTEQLAAQPRPPDYRNRARAHLLLGDTAAARRDFETAGNSDSRPSNGARIGLDADLLWLGTVDWLEAKYEHAAEAWLRVTRALSAGKVDYSDASGGVGAGSLLSFAATKLRDESLWQAALDLFSFVREQNRGDSWPFPVAAFHLGDVSELELLAIPSGPPPLLDRRLCQAHFAIGVAALRKNLSAPYVEAMARCASLRLAVLEEEYFLASHEVATTGGA